MEGSEDIEPKLNSTDQTIIPDITVDVTVQENNFISSEAEDELQKPQVEPRPTKEFGNYIQIPTIMNDHDDFVNDIPNPMDKASVLSRVFMSWLTPLLKLGSSRTLVDADVPRCPTVNSSKVTYNAFASLWELEIEKGSDASILHTIFKTFPENVSVSVTFFVLYLCSQLVQPFLVSQILEYVTTGHVNMFGVHSGLLPAGLLGMACLIGSVCWSLGFYNMQQFGLKIRTALMGTLFQKSLNISNFARRTHTTGEIITLMAVDIERVWMALLLANWLWMGPLLLAVSMILLWFEVGYASLVVTGALLLWGYFQEAISDRIGLVRRKFVKFTAERTKLMGEVLQGIRVVKLYAWEEPSQNRICEAREQELGQLEQYLLLRMTNTVLAFLGPVLVAFILFITYKGMGGELTIRKVYTCMAILNLCRWPIALFPMARAAAKEATTSLERIRLYLITPELKRILSAESSSARPSASESSEEGVELTVNKTEADKVLVSITDGYFTWMDGDNDVSSGKPESLKESIDAGHSILSQVDDDCPDHIPTGSCSLSGVNICIKEGELVAIVGSVGSGKTTLIMALLGQISKVQGEQYLNANVAYASQEHWIQNLSVKDNILFDAPFEDEVYASVMDAAQLSKDLLMLPNGDMTEIGERGINLSGGQKARVNIARAMYAPNSNLFIFDDPLAALDSHVGRAVFEEAFQGMLLGAAVIVTFSSNYHYLSKFDKIIVVEKSGKSHMCLSYDELKDKYPQFIAAGEESIGEEIIEKDLSSYKRALDIGNIRRGLSSRRNLNSQSIRYFEIEPPDYKQAISNVSSLTRGQSIYHNIQREISNRQSLSVSNTVTEEDREKGVVTMKTFLNYFGASVKGVKSSGGRTILVAIILLFAVGQVFRVFSDLWIGMWAKSYRNRSTSFYVSGYALIVLVTIVLAVARSVYFIYKCLGASKSLHDDLLRKVLAAPVNLYFDVTPVGRILNRFSKDLDSIDSNLPDFFLNFLTNGWHVLAVLAMCLASTPYFVIILLPLGILFAYIQDSFRKSSRELKRMEAVARSPVYTLFGELLIGLSTVRAFQRESTFLSKFHKICDHQNKYFFSFWVAARWLALRLDIISALVVTSVALIAVLMTKYGSAVNSYLLGVSLIFSLQLAGLLQWTVRTVIDTENNMTSVERLLAFNDIVNETSGQEINDPENSENWPSKGSIELKDVRLSYRPGLPQVLKGVTVSIPGGSKVGVCGRTGAGKSSLMLALFRIAEPENGSEIVIDGVDILKISLTTLRKRLTIIPQDPVMFSGTLRYNLDPFRQYNDSEVWEALERVQLKDDILSKFPKKLDHEISERGENISVGQRQLLCIARALLRKSRVIIMDEATASVDSFTDKKIQETIRTAFQSCTVLTIAHRLETIADYDLIMTMDEGTVVECGSPLELLTKNGSHFGALVNELGPDMKNTVMQTAQKRYDSINRNA